MSATVNRSGRPPGQSYILMPESHRVRAWYVGDDGQLERGPSGQKPRNLRNLLTRQGHREVTLMDIAVLSAELVEPGGRL